MRRGNRTSSDVPNGTDGTTAHDAEGSGPERHAAGEAEAVFAALGGVGIEGKVGFILNDGAVVGVAAGEAGGGAADGADGATAEGEGAGGGEGAGDGGAAGGVGAGIADWGEGSTVAGSAGGERNGNHRKGRTTGGLRWWGGHVGYGRVRLVML